MAIARFGLKDLLPKNIKLFSGPGCPVCVTPSSYIDKAIAYAQREDVLIATFGDMLRVPGSRLSLQEIRSQKGNCEVVYSPLDALGLAENNRDKKVIFLGVGFETTAPTIAATIREARKRGIKNFFVFCGHKVMPPALKALVDDEGLKLDGFILPAHVSTIIGSLPYDFLAKRYKIACVIAGFEPLDIMQGISILVDEIRDKKPRVEIQYSRVARPEGNKAAQKIMKDVFLPVDSEWRGLGVIPKSGLAIRKVFSRFDAEAAIPLKLPRTQRGDKGCICGEVLKGMKEPGDCKFFAKACTPEHPIGPCMVSSEGTCAARYSYS